MPGEDLRLGPRTVAEYVNAETPQERTQALTNLRALLPSWIRVFDHEDGLQVFYDWTESREKDPFLNWLAAAANYVEARYGGGARVIKGGHGPTNLKASMEPQPKSALDRLLEDDDLV